jgi:hypothetical protein
MRNCRTYSAHFFTGVSDWSDIPLFQSNIHEFLQMKGFARELVEWCQRENFGEEIYRLKRGKGIHPISHLFQRRSVIGPDSL